MPETVVDSLTKVPEEYAKLVNRARMEIGDELLKKFLTHICEGDFVLVQNTLGKKAS